MCSTPAGTDTRLRTTGTPADQHGQPAVAVEPPLGAFQVAHLDQGHPLGEPPEPLLPQGGAGPVQGKRPNQRTYGRPDDHHRQRHAPLAGQIARQRQDQLAGDGWEQGL